MAVIGALLKQQAVRDDVARQLAPIGTARFLPTAAALIAAAAAHEIDAVMIEVENEAGESSAGVIEALVARAKSVPVIVYDQFSPWRVEILREILLRRLLIEI